MKKVTAPEGLINIYLTPGKSYDIISNYQFGFEITDDQGDKLYCLFEECGHINGKNWIVDDNSIH